MSDKDWLKKLKIGDNVYVRSNGIAGTKYYLHTVQKITPTGRIRVNGDLYRDVYYSAQGSWSGYNLEKYTLELEAQLEAEALLNRMRHKINNMDVFGLSPDKVQEIYDIIKGD